jgi:hypothetical protein
VGEKGEETFWILTGGKWGRCDDGGARRRRVEAVVRGARWEGNTCVGGANRCEGRDRGVETVL